MISMWMKYENNSKSYDLLFDISFMYCSDDGVGIGDGIGDNDVNVSISDSFLVLKYAWGRDLPWYRGGLGSTGCAITFLWLISE